MNTIYDDINQFLSNPDADAADLAAFANNLLSVRPGERRFIQDWFLNMAVSERFSGTLFSDVVLTRQQSFSLDPKPLEARRNSR